MGAVRVLASGTTACLVAKGDLVERDADGGTHRQRLAHHIVAAHGLTLSLGTVSAQGSRSASMQLRKAIEALAA
jgi:hypothetical protein